MQRKINTHKPQFDLKTHVRDGKGNIAKENHYRLVIENGVHKYERPPGSKFFYDSAGNLLSAPKAVKMDEPKVDIDSKIAELETVHITAKDVVVDDVPKSVDLSEEIALMEKAGAVEKAAEFKKKQPLFKEFVK